MSEEPKRLAPTTEVVRKLYLKSGNQCAFPECRNLIMNSDGDFIGEVCHIEAAMPGGQRFNPKQINEERRSFDNLLLLCHEHHKVTDNVEVYSVEKLKMMKSEHERKFTDTISKIRDSVIDYAISNLGSLPKTLNRINSLLEWHQNESELEESLIELLPFIESLRKLPIPTRRLLTIMLQRARKINSFNNSLEFSPNEVMEACNMDIKEMRKHVSILDNYGLIAEGGEDEYGQQNIEFRDLISGWPIWKDLLSFSDKASIPLSKFTEELVFEELD